MDSGEESFIPTEGGRRYSRFRGRLTRADFHRYSGVDVRRDPSEPRRPLLECLRLTEPGDNVDRDAEGRPSFTEVRLGRIHFHGILDEEHQRDYVRPLRDPWTALPRVSFRNVGVRLDREEFIQVNMGSNPSPMNETEQEDPNYDVNLPCMHSYLGQELEVVRGRTVFDEGAVVTLDLLLPADVILMPGRTLPLTVFDPPSINMLRKCILNDRTFGVLASWIDGSTTTVSQIGTTAEIFEYLPETVAEGFRVKARARQRFKLLDPEDTNKTKARVRILPEVVLPEPLEEVSSLCLRRLRSSPSPQTRQRCRRADASVTRWPAFVYELYNVKRIVKEIKHELRRTFFAPKNRNQEGTIRSEFGESQVKVVIPDDPTDLSFWVAQNLPMKAEQRVRLMKLNSPLQRLMWELRAVKQSQQQMCCQFCKVILGESSHVFSMSTEGPQSTYVNPGGYLHETITLYRVQNVHSVGHPSTEFSWFPGYAWKICKCSNCNQHVGWKFTTTNSELKPSKFWGICQRAITVNVTLRNKDIEEEDEPKELAL